MLQMAAVIHTTTLLEEYQDVPEKITEKLVKAAINIVRLFCQESSFIARRKGLEDEIRSIQTHKN